MVFDGFLVLMGRDRQNDFIPFDWVIIFRLKYEEVRESFEIMKQSFDAIRIFGINGKF